MFWAMFSPIIKSNITLTTASGNVHIGVHYQKLWLQRYASDDGRKHRPKHVGENITRNMYS